MRKNLQVLSVEDSERDAALLQRYLMKAGYDLKFVRVESADEMKSALETEIWDVVLADYTMPKFNAMSALALLKKTDFDIPFIVVSGSIDEAIAIESMLAGADDCMMIDNLSRLVPAIERGMQEAENRRARRLAEKALRESEENYRLLFELNPLPMWVYDVGTLAVIAVNETAIAHYGYSREEFLSMTIKDIRPKENVQAFLEYLSKSHPDAMHKTSIWKHTKKDGSLVNVEVTSHALMFAGRKARIVLANDVTERVLAEEALKQTEKKYRSIFENAVEGIFQSTTDGRFIAVNPAMVKMLGFESAEDLIAHRTDIATQHYVDSKSRAELQHLIAKDSVVTGFECEVYRKDRSKIWTRENIRAIHDELGTILHYEGSIEDISKQKQLETQLLQSQKLEGIGRLAGGIAHDFNNLLTAIMGYSLLSLRKLHEQDPLYHNITEIEKAANRAASLTRQLLAFSRKQILQPKVLNLNEIVSDINKMLRRLIGENIELRTALSPDLGNVKADPGQIEQVIMNLVINARDAMDNGGKLTIETSNVYLDEKYASQHIAVNPGYFVMLAISDTGTGMDEETQSHIFEPFFTTKEIGKGTGLGLSTVYGIVKQSGGNIWVYSEPNQGTTFKIYLPRVDEDAEHLKRAIFKQEVLKGTETVLLAEDDEVVRNLACVVLETNGYKVLEAANGEAALLICEKYQGTINLLLTDVVMPEMSGIELAKRLAVMRPEMRVLYMSGYTENAVVYSGILKEGMTYIQKPFSPDDLAKKVRDVLDA